MKLLLIFISAGSIPSFFFQILSSGHPQDPLEDEIARAVVLQPRLSWTENLRKENSIRVLVLGD